MRFFLALLTLGFFLFNGPGYSEESSSACTEGTRPLEEIVHSILESTPDAPPEIVTGPLAALLTDQMNSIPPASEYKPDRVYVFSSPLRPTVLAIFVVQKCAVGAIQIMRPDHEIMKGQLHKKEA